MTIENEVFLIEELIPNDNDTLILGMSEYAENYEKYDAAIMQFTLLRCYTGLNDCVGQLEHPLNFLVLGNGAQGIVPRFDNILLYKGQIGLVDSEQCVDMYEKPQKERICKVIKENILMFPFHYEKLVKLAEELLAENGDKVSEEIWTELAEACEKSHELYDLVYRQNVDFYQQFEIGLDKPLPNRELSNVRREEITTHMLAFLQRADQKRSEGEVSILKKHLLPKIIEIIWEEIKKFEEQANKKLCNSPHQTTIGKLLEAGSFYGNHLAKIHQEVIKNCFQNDLTKEVDIPFRECIQEILKEMCGKEIAYFRQNVSTHLDFYDVLVV